MIWAHPLGWGFVSLGAIKKANRNGDKLSLARERKPKTGQVPLAGFESRWVHKKKIFKEFLTKKIFLYRKLFVYLPYNNYEKRSLIF
jgi:hypothetical protein